jgi:DNA (cytosine-5)-methyltransferase 1
MFGIIRTSRPTWILAENVAGHVTLGLDEVLSDLESEDYAVQPIIVPACAVDAPHRRDRVWIIADSDNARRVKQWRSESVQSKLVTAECGNRWSAEPDVGRVAYGIPRRVDRLRGLGNAIVPQVAYEIIKAMIEADESA